MAVIDVLVQDPHFVAVAKPSGLLVHRGWGNDAVTALDLTRDRLGRRVYPVHRLDRGTSGVLLFALDPASAALLHALLEAGGVEKRYLALVRGIPPEAGEIDHPIPRREGGPRVPAVTGFARLHAGGAHAGGAHAGGAHAGGAWALIEARPRTGRLHQVRRHLKHISHPVLGDANYGKGALNRLYRARYGLARLALHAAAVSFVNPWTGVPVRVAASLPDDLRIPFERMGVPPTAWTLASVTAAGSLASEIAGGSGGP